MGIHYNIGTIDAFSSLVSVAPMAIFTALFRPLFWEIGSPVMILSVIENTILLVFCIIILVRISPIKLVKFLLINPLLLYSIVFGVLFAFGVGIAGTNFGALVRYKIPFMPLFFPSIYISYKLIKNDEI